MLICTCLSRVGKVPENSYFPEFDSVMWLPYSDSTTSDISGALDTFEKGKPFLLYFTSALDPMHFGIPPSQLARLAGMDPATLMEGAMSMTDKSVSFLLDALKSRNLLENSLIVVFGDHGADFTRKYASPYHHIRGVAVASNNTRVPFFIHDGGSSRGIDNTLVWAPDVPFILSDILLPDKGAFRTELPLHGCNSLERSRKYCFSQNKYALQKTIGSGDEIAKSYAITDGSYRLIATNADCANETGGMEMYADRFDPGNQMDLLRLFEIDGQGRITGLNHEAIETDRATSFASFIIPTALEAIAEKYEAMRVKLRSYVRRKEELALLLAPDGKEYTLTPESFTKSVSGWKRKSGESVGFAVGWKKLFRDGKSILLYGMGSYNKVLIAACMEKCGLHVVGYMDSQQYNPRVVIDGKHCFLPHEAAERYPDAIVIDCSNYQSDIEENAALLDELKMEHYSYLVDIMNYKPWRRG
jgi:hypothetical protein